MLEPKSRPDFLSGDHFDRTVVDLLNPALNLPLPVLLRIRIDFRVDRFQKRVHQSRASLGRKLNGFLQDLRDLHGHAPIIRLAALPLPDHGLLMMGYL